MQKTIILILSAFASGISYGQKLEIVYLNPRDSSANMYLAVVPEGQVITSFMFLLDGLGASPKDVPNQTSLPQYAAKEGILTIIPILKPGPLYFGVDSASQRSLKGQIESVVLKYHLQGKAFYIGGFSIGWGCAVKYAELAVKNNYAVKPTAAFAVDPPLDWERLYIAAKRVVRRAEPGKVNGEVTYIITRIEKEMSGNPQTALENFYAISPYSFSDTTQSAIKNLVKTPIMLFSEPDIQWWLSQRGYDYSFINITDQAAMINELQKLGNGNAVLVTTTDKGFRQPGANRHPHSWRIADPAQLVGWLKRQK